MSGIRAVHAPRIRRVLDALNAAGKVSELNVPGWFLHALRGSRKGVWSLRVSGNYRITFEFRDGDAHLVDLEDYH